MGECEMRDYAVILKVEVRVKARNADDAIKKALSHVKQSSDSIVGITVEEPKEVS